MSIRKNTEDSSFMGRCDLHNTQPESLVVMNVDVCSLIREYVATKRQGGNKDEGYKEI